MTIAEFVKNFISTLDALLNDQKSKLAQCSNNTDIHYTQGALTAYIQCMAFAKALENSSSQVISQEVDASNNAKAV